MNKDQAKKYISGRSLEIMCELEIVTTHKMRERLSEEFAFLRYVNNLIDYAEEFTSLSDECDTVPGNTTFKEYKGYVLQQSGYNNHYMIFKNHSVVMHSACSGKLNQKEAEECIEIYIKESNNDNKSNGTNG